MFYPEASLKKGGRFYLCWVADSWPVCFATITQRQLWSQDIRIICDDLLQVMNNESGRPAHRFSLRLSSQLMRGLVRLYQKKVNILLSDLCMIGARVMKHSNKKFNIDETPEEMQRHMIPLLELPAPVREPIPEPEERVEEMIQQSGNAVTNIENITLKEAAIPEFQLPPNDGFGEENPNQALQLLQDRTLEEMLGAPGPAHSALGASDLAPGPADLAPGPADRTRDAGLAVETTLERMSDHDLTLFRKSTAQDLLPEELDKEIPIPEIPPPDLPAPVEKEPLIPEPEVAPAPEPAEVAPAVAAPPPAPQEPEIVTLETLEEGEPPAKRRRKHKLIIDKNHQLTKKFLRARIENIHVDLRCEEFSDDIVDLRVPADVLLTRPARGGTRFHCNIARALARLYSRNLGVIASEPRAQREMEFALASRARRPTVQPVLEPIPEEPQPQEPQMLELQQPIEEPTVLNQSTAVPDLNATAVPDLNATAVDVEKDIADMLTQKLEKASQKRTSQEDLNTSQTKRQRCGVNLRQTRSQNIEPEEQDIVEKENIPDNRQTLPSKENIPDNRQTLPSRQTDEQPLIPDIEIQRPSNPERVLSSMLQQAGLADIQVAQQEPMQEEPRRSRRRSESSETMLGSLDRTKVSLGDSDQTTDSKRFIRDQWGTEGTMVKILKMAKAEVRPLNMDSLMSFGPVVPGYTCIIAARCFTSILNHRYLTPEPKERAINMRSEAFFITASELKQHGFIKVRKDPDTLEIIDIRLGPKFDIP